MWYGYKNKYFTKGKPMNKKVLIILLLLAIIVMGRGQAFAGGLWMYEGSIPDMGMANAGRAASALDASTAFGNPAGMTGLTAASS